MICNTCKKLIVNKIGKKRCAVLRTDKSTSNQGKSIKVTCKKFGLTGPEQ